VHSATQVRNLIGLTPVGQRVRLVFERDRALGNATVEVAPIPEERTRTRTSG
jgi:serine protease Do